MEFLTGQVLRGMKGIEQAMGVIVSARGNKVFLQGDDAKVQRAVGMIDELRSMRAKGVVMGPEELADSLRALASDEAATLEEFYGHSVAVSPRKRPVVPKNRHQIEYIDAIEGHDIVFGIGPAGTGKTYIAMAMAISALLTKRVSRVVLARPAVEAGEKLGFLPGDMIEKVNPYLRPLYDALYAMVELEKANRMLEQGVIEIAPLAFMRGRTLNDAFIILDEAQNTTSEQMKMYLTRLGFNSKTVVTGDVTQIDLPQGKASGLIEAEKILSGVEGMKFIYFTERDVVRHKLVQKIVKAYEVYERQQSDKSGKDRPAS